jgi:hypothetical protein
MKRGPSSTKPCGLGRPSPAVRQRVLSAAKRVRAFASVTLCLFLLGLPLALAGCGKRNAPEPPPGVPNTYPRPYPSE